MSTNQLQRVLFCANCKKHTEHREVPTMYATQCTVCNALTNTLMRLNAEQASPPTMVAPDGTPAKVVENTPDEVTFFVESGEHMGYYTHNKRTGSNEIRQV